MFIWNCLPPLEVDSGAFTHQCCVELDNQPLPGKRDCKNSVAISCFFLLSIICFQYQNLNNLCCQTFSQLFISITSSRTKNNASLSFDYASTYCHSRNSLKIYVKYCLVRSTVILDFIRFLNYSNFGTLIKYCKEEWCNGFYKFLCKLQVVRKHNVSKITLQVAGRRC